MPDPAGTIDEPMGEDEKKEFARLLRAGAAEIERLEAQVARIRSEAERETVQRIVAWLRHQQELPAWHRRVADAIDRKFGDEDKGGEPR